MKQTSWEIAGGVRTSIDNDGGAEVDLKETDKGRAAAYTRIVCTLFLTTHVPR